MNAFAVPGLVPVAAAPFQVEIVGEEVGPLRLASGVPVNVQRAIGTVRNDRHRYRAVGGTGAERVEEEPISAVG
jgi:hypothetical protein